ncbi:hypothetical protein SS1G_00905 [Sclerotinia sclerotiorum 1980 UF-70]|uniref:Fe2OG dioxygenase domain-containing protein n=1 Tax=Sclerotinia sclerotiorum (strain ATCC 18683 / 1980 / Ss-1) TaxID=665079 RepID=A7E6I0_SCLS1|nr:hypothetical protein SS1G_00905 [Sclerotinia sclerotiorum 1980 UF-70]EDN91502.1 hypothetical protein SS1G_00905 [Sclerotinia sclerotiorum 1980 UF-70]
MFEIDEQTIPFIRTRQALLLLDLQNDFIGEGSLLPVEKPSSYIDNIKNLIEPFRPSGDIIWICSVSTEGVSRIVNQPRSDSEAIITNKELPRPRRDVLPGAGSEEDAAEAFLTVQPEGKEHMLKPNSRGSEISDRFAPVSAKDLVFNKTYYSAFKDGSLVQKLRGKFVTEIYIAGALTNVSVFATAMDAARHGYAITIVEDCLGYRSKARHEEALRQLRAYTGCDVISSGELIECLQKQKKVAERKTTSKADDPPATTVTAPSSTAAIEDDSDVTIQLLRAQIRRAKPPAELEAEAKKRERAKSKTKSRRHNTKPVEVGGPSSPSKERSPTSSKSPSPDSSASPNPVDKPVVKAALACPETRSTEKQEFQVKLPSEKETLEEMPNGEDSATVDTAKLCEGDTTVIHKLLPEELASGIFEKIRDEIFWQKMGHQGGEVPRLVAVQGQIEEDGSIPTYRHPADESPALLTFSPTVEVIKNIVEKRLGHPVNHALIQFYRDGNDNISEHSDKTLDIVPNTFIANVSLGAQRTMVFRRKKSVKSAGCIDSQSTTRESCRAALPHNSLCKMGLETNKKWLHGIRPDKRMASEKSEAELAYDGGRISLTFRHIGTYLDKSQQKIWGQGATTKRKQDAKLVINGDTPQSQEMLQAFGKENHDSNFDWHDIYGKGFDVLHMSNSKKLYLSGDFISDRRVKFILNEYNIPWIEATISPSFHWKKGSSTVDNPAIPETPIKFVDNDPSKTTVEGCMPIMFYLEAIYCPNKDCRSPAHLARHYTRFEQANTLLKIWQTAPFNVKPFRAELAKWNIYAQEAEYIAGDDIGLADFAIMPVFEMASEKWSDSLGFEPLAEYWKKMSQKESFLKVLPKENVEALQNQASLCAMKRKINTLTKEKLEIEGSAGQSSAEAEKDNGKEIEELSDGIAKL